MDQSHPLVSSAYGEYTVSSVTSPVSGSSALSTLSPYSPVAGSCTTQIIAASPFTHETTTTPCRFHGSKVVFAPTPKFSWTPPIGLPPPPNVLKNSTSCSG